MPTDRRPATATARSRARNQRAAEKLPVITLDTHHAECLRYILDETDETASALVRRLIRSEAAQRGAPVE